jgi:hypothetical protein
MAGTETWHRILNAIERLQAKAPAEGETVHHECGTEVATNRMLVRTPFSVSFSLPKRYSMRPIRSRRWALFELYLVQITPSLPAC